MKNNTMNTDTPMNTAQTTTANTAMNTDPHSMMMILKAIPSRFHSRMLLSLSALKKSEWYRKVSDPQTLESVLTLAEAWLQNHQGTSTVYRHMLNIVTSLKQMHKDGRLFTRRNALLLAAIVLYTVSPLDSVPDALPVIGLLDDLLLLVLGVRCMQGESVDAPGTDTTTL